LHVDLVLTTTRNPSRKLTKKNKTRRTEKVEKFVKAITHLLSIA